MNSVLPTGCKSVKLNLSNAYRTTYTHLQPGDYVRVVTSGYHTPLDQLVPAAARAPKASFWVQVRTVVRGNRSVTVYLEGRFRLAYDAPHTAVTRKERTEEFEARMVQARADRDVAFQAAETGIWAGTDTNV